MIARRSRQSNPGIRAIQTAGPSRVSLIGATLAGFLAILIVSSLGVVGSANGGWITYAALPVIAFVIAGLADRDAMLARRAIVEYAVLQARRLPPDYPASPEAASAWLIDPAHAAEDPIRRAFILDFSGEPEAAREELERIDPADTAALASAERLRAALAARADEPWDESRFEKLVGRLPDDEGRWQRLGLAFTLLVEDIRAGRPWRPAYVAAVRDLGPWHTTRRGWFVVITQQFTLAIVCGIPILLLAILTRT